MTTAPPDATVVGLGPAGRALTPRLLAHGARVLAIDPHPQRAWRPTYGGWRHQLPQWLDPAVVGASSSDTVLQARGRHRLDGDYLVLDNALLQRSLDISGAEVRAEQLGAGQLDRLPGVVVDCRGNTRRATASTPVQTAHGLKLDADAAAPLLGGAQAVLMDWLPFDGSPRWGRRRASFCYVVPLPDGRVLAEETCLAGRPPIPASELAIRLALRLRRHGIAAQTLDRAEVERVHIPMLAPLDALPLRFGSAGAELNPITGYSVFASLAEADAAARHVLQDGRLPHRRRSAAAEPVRRLALESLVRLDGDGTLDLFDAFGRLPASARRAVLDPRSPASSVVAAMARQWLRMPGAGRRKLVSTTCRGILGLAGVTAGGTP